MIILIEGLTKEQCKAVAQWKKTKSQNSSVAPALHGLSMILK